MKKLLLAPLLLCGLVMYYSCTKDHASLPVAPSGCDSLVTYNLRVANILNTYCGTSTTSTNAGLCHDPTSHNLYTGGSYGGYVYLYDSLHSVTAFQNQNALCFIEGPCGSIQMPYLGYGGIPDSLQTVPADTINVLKCWISNGYR